MTREELIDHLEHLAEYVKYSEDAPALREVIEILKCSEMPNSSKDFFWKNARKNARKYTETHACDLIERETARRIIDSPRSKEQMLWMLEATPPAQPDHSADVSKMVNGDVVSRQAAINIVVFECGEWTGLAKEISKQLRQLSPAQPDIIRCKDCKHWRSNTEFCSTFTELNVAHRMPPNGFCSCAERREE